MTKVDSFSETTFATRDSIRLIRDVGHQAKLETRRINKAVIETILFGACILIVLCLDYAMAFTMFDEIIQDTGELKLGATFVALIVTIAVAGIALLLYRSKKSAFAHAFNTFYGVGLFFLLLGIGSMFALVIVNGAEYLVFDDAPIFGQAGSEAIGGDRSSGDNAYTVFKSLIAGIPQVVFFIGMALSLFVSSFIIHALIEFCLTRYEFFGNASTRAKELKALTEEFEECRYKYDLIAGTKKRAKADLPIDPESHFAKTASAKANSALHQMSRHLTTMLRNGGQLDVLQAGLSEKNDIPPHIKSLEDWQKLNAEIGDVIRPYAILNALGAIPPKEQG